MPFISIICVFADWQAGRRRAALQKHFCAIYKSIYSCKSVTSFTHVHKTPVQQQNVPGTRGGGFAHPVTPLLCHSLPLSVCVKR